MNFRKPSYSHLTPQQLDALALSGEPLDSMGYGLRLRPDASALNSEHYSIRTIATKGMGNHGTVVLIGKTPYGRRLVRLGKISRLCRLGCPFKIAKVAASSPYGMEEGVWRLASDLLPLAKAGLSLRFSGRADFEFRTGLTAPHLSFPRIDAACHIAERAV